MSDKNEDKIDTVQDFLYKFSVVNINTKTVQKSHKDPYKEKIHGDDNKIYFTKY